MYENSRQCRLKLRSQYQNWIHEILNTEWNGLLWTGSLITFMFDHIPGGFERKCEMMEDEIDRVYRTLVPQVDRSPTSPAGSKRLPILMTFPDTRQQPHCGGYWDAVVNDGLHYHGIIAVPTESRLKVGLKFHFSDHEKWYIRPGYPLKRIHVAPVHEEATVKRAFGYGFKSLEWRIPDTDRIFIRPRTLSELPV
jgi:hypothetical protein